MIELYQGRIGGGKTYSAVRHILRSIAAGRTVYTNIEFHWPGVEKALAKWYGIEADPDQLHPWPGDQDRFGWHEKIRWGTPDCPVLVVIDEAQLHYNSRDWSDTQKHGKAMLSFLTQSRKAFVDVIFITQEIGNIDKQFRVLCQFIWNFRDMKYAQIPVIGFLVGKSFFFTKMDYGGAQIDSGLIPKDPTVFEAYNTFAFLDPAMAAKAEKEMERAIQKRQPRKLTFWERVRVSLGRKRNQVDKPELPSDQAENREQTVNIDQGERS